MAEKQWALTSIAKREKIRKALAEKSKTTTEEAQNPKDAELQAAFDKCPDVLKAHVMSMQNQLSYLKWRNADLEGDVKRYKLIVDKLCQ